MQPQGSHLGLILPLCTSSATVGLAVFQYPVFLSFLQAKPSTAGRPLSRYWEPFLKQGGGVILGLGLTSSISGLVSWRWLQTHGHLETTAVSKWYGYGALFALAHFAFVPLVAGPIKTMMDVAESSKSEDEVEETNRKEMGNWLLWHTVRTVVADLPALWCFAEGVALSFWVIWAKAKAWHRWSRKQHWSTPGWLLWWLSWSTPSRDFALPLMLGIIGCSGLLATLKLNQEY
jgi:Domain of unknown function (DUF1772)